MSEPLLRVSLDAGYKDRSILSGLQFQIATGEILGMVGNSGAGKSTLILALMGLLSWRGGWARGEVVFEGNNLIGLKESEMRPLRGRRIALIPQSPASALNPHLKLSTHFREAWRAHDARSQAELRQRLEVLLEQVGLPSDPEFLSRRPAQISVGQAQRIVIALALLHRPALVIADEPTSALDAGNRQSIMDLLHQANSTDGTAILYVSHDLLSVLQLCQHMAVLHEGRIVESLPISMIDQHATHPLTIALLKSLPIPAEVLQTYKQRARHEAQSGKGTNFSMHESPDACPILPCTVESMPPLS